MEILIAIAAMQALGSFFSSNKQAEMQGKYYSFLADQSKLKADLLKKAGEEEVTYAQDEGARLSKDLAKNIKQLDAVQKTTMISQGIELGSVTAEDIATDTLSKEKLDEMAIRYNADLKSYQARKSASLQALQAYGEAASLGLSGQMQSSATRLNAYSSLLGNASQISMQGYQLNKLDNKNKTKKEV